MIKRQASFLIFLLFLLGNYWLWRIFHRSLFLGLFGLLLSIIFFKFKNNLKKGLVFFLSGSVLIAFLFFQTKPSFIFHLDDLEIYTVNQRRSYYSIRPLGFLLENKPVYIFSKWQKNVFESLDLNNYFFAGHPRERSGIAEYKKFPFIYLPIWLLGLLQTVKKKNVSTLLYPLGCIFFISTFAVVGESLFILFPWFVVVLSRGLEAFFNFLPSV